MEIQALVLTVELPETVFHTCASCSVIDRLRTLTVVSSTSSPGGAADATGGVGAGDSVGESDLLSFT